MDAPSDQRGTKGAKGVPKPGLFGTSFDAIKDTRSEGAMKKIYHCCVVVVYPRGVLSRGAGHPRGINPRSTDYPRGIKEVTYETEATIRS